MKNVLFAALIIFIAGCGKSEEPAQKDVGNIAAIDSLIHAEIEQEHIPGAVIRVQQGDRVLHQKAYGFARLYDFNQQKIDEPEPMSTDHLFDLASLTKVFGTTFGIMLLVDHDKIQLDDPIYKWLPEFESGEKKQITVRHLLTHTAGLYQWQPTYYHASNKNAQYQYISTLPLKWPVGEERHYSDLGFMLLGRIIEKESGRPLDVFLEEELYSRLDLAHTTFNPDTSAYKAIAWTSHGNPFERHMVYEDSFGYNVDVDPQSWDGWRTYTLHGEVNDGNAWYGADGVAGHAGLFSTVGDLQKLVTLLLNKGTYDSRPLISEAVIDTFLTRDKFGNGLGWAMDPDVVSAEGAPAGTFGHTGFTGTNVVVMPKKKISVILLTNRQHSGPQPDGYYYNLNQLRQQIVDSVLQNVSK